MARRDFGTIRKLPSGRYQARYVGNDEKRYAAGTFATKRDARDALMAIAADMREQGAAWMPHGVDPDHDETLRVDKVYAAAGWGKRGEPTFGDFAEQVLAIRAERLAPRTLEGYESLLKRWLLPTFGQYPLKLVTVQRVDKWWSAMGESTGKVNRRNAYFLLSSIMRYAVRYRHITASPCVVEDAGKNAAAPRPWLSVEDFERIVEAMPRHLHAPLWVMFGAHLRLGELCGLNRGDVDLAEKTISVTRQSQVVRGGTVLRETKTGSHKKIRMLQPAVDALEGHLRYNTEPDSAPLFRGVKGGRLSRGYVSAQWVKARELVGLPESHLHDVRHTSLTLVAAYGTTAETMKRGGHTSVAAAMKYQHATADRDAVVAEAASAAISRS